MFLKGGLSCSRVWVGRPKLSCIGGGALGHYSGWWVWVGRPKHPGVVLLVRGRHVDRGPKWWRPQKGRGSRNAPDAGIVHLLDRRVGDMVWPQHVLEAEGPLRHRLLRDALRQEAGGQVRKRAGVSQPLLDPLTILPIFNSSKGC